MRGDLPLISIGAALLAAIACSSQPTVRRPEVSPTASPQPAPPSPPLETGKPPSFLPTTSYSGGDGSSVENAVVIMADTEEEGVRLENEWIFARYGEFRKTGVGLATVEHRKYDSIRVELPDHTEKEIFFDITSFFGKESTK